jgi:hypothetical protein
LTIDDDDDGDDDDCTTLLYCFSSLVADDGEYGLDPLRIREKKWQRRKRKLCLVCSSFFVFVVVVCLGALSCLAGGGKHGLFVAKSGLCVVNQHNNNNNNNATTTFLEQ